MTVVRKYQWVHCMRLQDMLARIGQLNKNPHVTCKTVANLFWVWLRTKQKGFLQRIVTETFVGIKLITYTIFTVNSKRDLTEVTVKHLKIFSSKHSVFCIFMFQRCYYTSHTQTTGEKNHHKSWTKNWITFPRYPDIEIILYE